jgi:glycosyltransferase involved in cell wall biosynthesis
MSRDPFIVCVLPSFAGGGAERACINLCNALSETGWRVGIVTIHGSGPMAIVPADAVERYDLGAKRVLAGIFGLCRLLRSLKPDVVLSTPAHLNMAVLLCARWLGKTRLIVREANTPSATLPLQPWPRVFRFGYRTLYRRAFHVICPAERVAIELHALGVPEAQTMVLPNPVDVEAVRAQARNSQRAPGEGVRLIAAGRLAPQKGFRSLVRAMRSLPECTELDIFGDGPDREALNLLIAELQLQGRVRLRGFSAELWSWVAGADAFVLSSRWEGMPNVVLEALACGTPVVALRGAGGVAELRVRESAALILADDDYALTACLRALQPWVSSVARPSQLAREHEPDAVVQQFSAMALAGLKLRAVGNG